MKYIKIIAAVFVFTILFVTPMLATQTSAIHVKTKFSAVKQTHQQLPTPGIGTSGTYGLFNGALPCIGSPRIVVLVIDFKDDDIGSFDASVSDIEESFFNADEHPSNPLWQSLSKFYSRSSYGQLDISGDVFHCVTTKNKAEYANITSLLNDVMEIACAEYSIDWSEYDANQDGYVDGVYFILRGTFQGIGHQVRSFIFTTPQGTKISQCVISTNHGNILFYFAYIAVLAHETCHLMGLPDIYSGVWLNNGGTWATSIMNKGANTGDLPGIMKSIFGWTQPQYITADETQIQLSSFSDNPDLVIISVDSGDEDNDWLFVVEYVTVSSNNMELGVCAGLQASGGLLVWKIKMLPNYFEYIQQVNYTPPTPYTFIETIHPEGIRDHFLYTGDSLTPFTTPNTNYPTSIIHQGGNSIQDELMDSGIYIENILIENEIANFTVSVTSNSNGGGDRGGGSDNGVEPQESMLPNKNDQTVLIIISAIVILGFVFSINFSIFYKKSK